MQHAQITWVLIPAHVKPDILEMENHALVSNTNHSDLSGGVSYDVPFSLQYNNRNDLICNFGLGHSEASLNLDFSTQDL